VSTTALFKDQEGILLVIIMLLEGPIKSFHQIKSSLKTYFFRLPKNVEGFIFSFL